jgi:hypothetical protein
MRTVQDALIMLLMAVLLVIALFVASVLVAGGRADPGWQGETAVLAQPAEESLVT